MDYGRLSKGMVTADGGCELISDDGSTRIVLHQTRDYSHNVEHSYFSTAIYTRSAKGWERALSGSTFESRETFLAAIERNYGFTQALNDISSNF